MLSPVLPCWDSEYLYQHSLQMNSLLFSLSKELNVTFADFSSKLEEEFNFAIDGLHFTRNGYFLFANYLEEVIEGKRQGICRPSYPPSMIPPLRRTFSSKELKKRAICKKRITVVHEEQEPPCCRFTHQNTENLINYEWQTVPTNSFSRTNCASLHSTSTVQAPYIPIMGMARIHTARNFITGLPKQPTPYVMAKKASKAKQRRLRRTRRQRARKMNKRQLERKMKKSGLQIDKEIFQEHCKTYHKSLESAKREHYQSKIADCSQKQLFRIADKLTSAKPMKTLPAHESLESLSEDFHTFFDSKIEKIHEKLSKTDVSPVSVDVAESCASRFDSFDEVDEECVRMIITESAKTSCGLDPIPTSILAKPEILDAMLPVITRIVNMSLRQAIAPSMLKRALVTPLIKKVNLDPDTFKNYRPISNFPFLFKVIERVASSQIQRYVSENSLGGDRQSAYRKQHSTETALLRLSNDILRAVDNHQNVIVVLLDLTAAFDTLDHQILLQRLYNRFGITGTALQWMESYFHERQQCVCIDGICSDWKFVSRGAPQGSVFGPMAFSYYSVPVENVIKAHNLECMVYADDSQIYCCFDNQDMDISVSRVEKCVADVRSWMIRNHLMLNDSKTELLHLTSRFSSTPEAPALRVGDAVVTPSASARNLGAVLDKNVTMNQHVNSICRSASFALYNIGKLRPYLDKASKLKHLFMLS